MPRRRPPLAPVALAAVTAAVVVIAILAVGSPSASTAREREVTVAHGVVQQTVSGSGTLSPANQLSLSFKTSGVVTHVYVKAGEHVSEGQLLAALDPSSAEVTLAQAKADLQTAEDNLSKAQSGASSSTATAATAATAKTATASIASADADAPSSADSDAPQKESSTKQKPQSQANTQSQSNTQNQANPQSQSGGNGSSSTMSVAAAEAAVESAKLSVSDAEKAVAATKLRAPMPGTIAEVNGAAGDSVSAGSGNGTNASNASSSGSDSGFFTFAQLSRYTMTVSLSESDIGKLKKGQAATVTVNAASGEQFEAHVTHIAVLSSSSSDSSGATGGGGGSSAVSYPVELTLNQTSDKLKAGMSASADIIVAHATGLVVPTQALQGNTVTVLRDGERSTQQVQTGVAGDSTTQILGGLKEGDTVIVTSSAAAAAAGSGGLGNAQGRGGLGRFGGGGFGGGGGPQVFRGPGP